MKKTIDFVIASPKNNAKKTTVRREVDLSALSYTAMCLALSIWTTDQRDDLSSVNIRCKYTNHELFQRVVSDATRRYDALEVKNAKKHLEDIQNGDMWDEADKVMSNVYLWDKLGDDETPEDYFERHARYIETEAFPYLKDGELEDPISKIKFLRVKHDYTLEKLSEISGVSRYQISRFELNKSDIRNMTLKNAAALASALGVHAEDLM